MALPFDAFRHHFQADVVGEADDRGADARVVVARLDGAHERLVDLEGSTGSFLR